MRTETEEMQNGAVTFFAWSDMHFGYQQGLGEADIRWQALEQMKRLPGWPYPPEMGGCVTDPSLILVCGDFVDGGPDGERFFECYRNWSARTGLPAYEAAGNHDLVHKNVREYFAARYGSTSYSFDHAGIHFVALCQTFDPAEKVEALDKGQLTWLESDLAGLEDGTPVILFAHDAPHKQPDADAVYEVISGANVILVLSGHTHGRPLPDGIGPRRLHFYRWHGITGAVTGHVRNHPIDMTLGRTFFVVRVTPEEVAAVPWRWDLAQWARGQGWGEASPEHMVVPRD